MVRATKRTGITVEAADVCECYGFNVGSALAELDCAAGIGEKKAREHLVKAKSFLLRELERNDKAGELAVIDGPIEFESVNYAKIFLLAHYNPFWATMFKPGIAKDIRSFGRVTKHDIRDLVDLIDITLGHAKEA